jgi:hypothetical protein
MTETVYEYSIHKVSEKDFNRHSIGDAFMGGVVIDGVSHTVSTPDGRIGFVQPLLITSNEAGLSK